MNEFSQEIAKRHITRLCHFTKSSNLLFILGNGQFEKNGILPAKYIKESPYLDVLDKKRAFKHEDYISCSIQQVDSKYYQEQKRRDLMQNKLFNQWVALYIDPYIIDDSTLFSPVNASKARGRNLKQGIEAFKNLFASEISYIYHDEQQGILNNDFTDRSHNLPTNYTTDGRAEILIKDYIPKNKIIGIAFPNDTYDLEKQRLAFCLPYLDIQIYHWSER